jgi:hypothetical protein
MEGNQKVGLYQKIHQVMQDIEYLQKDDRVRYKTTDYRAISEEKVTSKVRDSLVKNRLIILPIEQEHSKEGMLTTVDTKYKIIDIDTGEYEIIVSSGTGVDTQDKGVGKAMTYSYKYLLLRSFAIPTGEDPDKVSSEELDDQVKKNAQKKIDALAKNLNLQKSTLDELSKKYNGDKEKVLLALDYLIQKRTA